MLVVFFLFPFVCFLSFFGSFYCLMVCSAFFVVWISCSSDSNGSVCPSKSLP